MRRLRDQKQALESEINDLQGVIGFNEEMLDDANADAFDALIDQEAEHVADGLLADEGVTCWTCGSSVDRGQIKSTLGELRELSEAKVGEVTGLEEALEEAKREKRELEQTQRERERIERRLDELKVEIEEGEERIERLEERKEQHRDEIADIEAAVEELESEEYSAILNLHKEANQLEYELGKLESDLDRVEEEIADIESRIDERPTVEAQLEEIREEITTQRTKIERIEQDAIEQFNEHMDQVLDILDYENLDRIWLERRETEVREGRRTVSKSVFDLHVVRKTASGNAYEDTVDHLSGSEQEVTGLVFALAGYLAHEVYEEVPFMLLDSLEAIDAERIAAIVEYLGSHTGYLLAALLPDDAAALPDAYDRVTQI
jgi:DNA repair exonuclease SbcCD ATPase subunit